MTDYERVQVADVEASRRDMVILAIICLWAAAVMLLAVLPVRASGGTCDLPAVVVTATVYIERGK